METERNIPEKLFVPTETDMNLAALLLKKGERDYETSKKDVFLMLSQRVVISLVNHHSLDILPSNPIKCLLEINEVKKSDLSKELGFDVNKSKSEITPEDREKASDFIINGVCSTLDNIIDFKSRDRRQKRIFSYFIQAEGSEEKNHNIVRGIRRRLEEHFAHDDKKAQEPTQIRERQILRNNDKLREIKRVLLGIKVYSKCSISIQAKNLHVGTVKIQRYQDMYMLDEQGNVVHQDGKPLDFN